MNIHTLMLGPGYSNYKKFYFMNIHTLHFESVLHVFVTVAISTIQHLI